MIKISIRDIPSKGLDIDRDVSMEGLGLSCEEVDIRTPINVKAHLEKTGNVVIAAARIRAEFGFLCARCLQEMSEAQERSYKFDFELDPAVEYIDLGEEIRQEIIMANPARVLCRKDCKGICPKCGVNLNVEKCKCV
ncbi:MAG: DUF177 domain-containing protein [Candidatus Omnitrophica bacterium]|nr:DUF177 domain-containing protein [Candidatus Omnitrophota bacterium]MDE2010348.1 DUF177 domain-containing protein [Candidatus Omnitrophota bacterium]MDE2215435.1 DUF177 domain-containing protein [Candidatus Omnitrophota bacterium]MDE2232249.1 DUF177 domain-containing protein [Candidatus Omnitrophota bacterium]